MKKQPVLCAALVLLISGSGLQSALAKDTEGKDGEVWTAPPQSRVRPIRCRAMSIPGPR